MKVTSSVGPDRAKGDGGSLAGVSRTEIRRSDAAQATPFAYPAAGDVTTDGRLASDEPPR